MPILSRLWRICSRPPGSSGADYKGGDRMVLQLYHDTKEVHTVMNVIKVTVDNLRTITVKIKDRRQIEYQSFRHEQDYQRFTVQVD